MKKILQKGDKVLRENAKEVPVPEIKTSKIKKILEEMSVSLASQSDGVALAAPQIGYSLQIFVVSGKVLESDFVKKREKKLASVAKSEEKVSLALDRDMKDLVFINPKISKLSREKEWTPEGCLSVRPLYGKAFRSKKATVSAYDENGKKFTRGGSGLLAQIFQHETDHLKGILFVDHAKDVKEEKW